MASPSYLLDQTPQTDADEAHTPQSAPSSLRMAGPISNASYTSLARTGKRGWTQLDDTQPASLMYPGKTMVDQVQYGERPRDIKRLKMNPSNEKSKLSVQEMDNGIKYVTVHQVICAAKEVHHSGHGGWRLYHDVPQLFANDHKKCAIRGLHKVDAIEDFAIDHPDISFAAVLLYNCEQYHDRIADNFEQLEIPPLDKNLRKELEPLFCILRDDGPLATAYSQGISILAPVLREAVGNLKNNMPRYFRDVVIQDSRLPALHITSYSQFYHINRALSKIKAEVGANLTLSQWMHFNILCNYICTMAQAEFNSADCIFARGFTTRQHLSKLFGPDELVVDMSGEMVKAYVVDEILEIPGNPFELDLSCWSWEYDGIFKQSYRRLKVRLPSVGIDAEMPMLALGIYPLKFDRGNLKSQIRKRGEMFWSCRIKKFVTYVSKSSAFTTTPRFMIDIAMYKRMHNDGLADAPASPGDTLRHLDLSNQEHPPDDPFIFLLPNTIRGYGFHDKKWRSLSVDDIREISWSKEAFDRHLVLKPQKKELIKALITVHKHRKSSYQSDIIEGKGKGLIILLHGSPGTGKTLTAESIAEFTEKPLYRVTCGDIGTDPETVEKYLESVLFIGTVWECVVLLDEADVFLEERTPTDLQRNALVSSFLRVLEYFEGILILTSNRIGAFDEAFKSRVQLALHYPPLDESGRWEVWNNFLKTMSREGVSMDYEEIKAKLDVLARSKLNGRQIRNTVNTSRQLARYKGEQLTYTHFHQAIEVLNEFETYVALAHGHTDEEYAGTLGARTSFG